MALDVHLDAFDGPLDLLLYLIEKNQVDIYDIPVSEITKQYLDSLKAWDEMNMDVASEFIVMAATLIRIKAGMLLPVQQSGDEEEEDPRKELVQRLVQYKIFKEAAGKLSLDLPDPERLTVQRNPEKMDLEKEKPDVSLLLSVCENSDGLYQLFLNCMALKEDRVDPIRSEFRSVEHETYTVEEKIDALYQMLTQLESVSLMTLRKDSHSKLETITFFQAMLELDRMNLVTLEQTRLFSDIVMKPRETSNG